MVPQASLIAGKCFLLEWQVSYKVQPSPAQNCRQASFYDGQPTTRASQRWPKIVGQSPAEPLLEPCVQNNVWMGWTRSDVQGISSMAFEIDFQDGLRFLWGIRGIKRSRV